MPEQSKYDPVLDAPKESPPSTPPGSEAPSPAPDEFARKRSRTSPRVKMLILGAAVALVVGSFFLWRYLNSYESTDDAQIDGHLNPISARLSGYVLRVNVDDNQYVEKGAALVEIDPKDYQVAVDKARADLADAQATAQASSITVPITSVSTTSQVAASEADLENSRAGIAVAEKQEAAIEAQVQEAEANDAKAQADLARYKQLVDKQEISEQQYDQAVAAAKASAATVAAARANEAAAMQAIRQARSKQALAEANLRASQTAPQQVASTRARALSAEAMVQQKRAALEQAELNLQYTKIVAPASGIVSKNVEVGMNVQPGQQLLSIVPLDEVWVTANFKETQLRQMRPGQRAVISVDAYGGRTYKGRVDSIAGSSGARQSLLPPENATGNYVKVVQRIPVKVVLEPGENRDHQLRLGMSVIPKVYVR
jgi:membrane fusion protein (multidrug efflux system)